MLDPISLTAVTAALGAVGMGTANEAGKWAWESAGGLVRRITGREVPAPADQGELESVARAVHEGLRRDPQLAHAWAALARSVPTSPGGYVPRPEFPPSTRFFTDREKAMKKLGREASRAADGRPRIALLHGPQGMGTSTLAVHWGAREAAKRFPDGRLYVDLRGTSTGSALDAGTALRSLLRQLGVPQEEIPPAAEDRISLYRQLVHERRLLVVLDHAHSAAQVRPLLTPAAGVFLLVVAAAPLAGLDAVPVRVEPLSARDAERLLTDLAGKEAVAAAGAVLSALIARCGGSPFALRAAAPRLTAPTPQTPPTPPTLLPSPSPSPSPSRPEEVPTVPEDDVSADSADTVSEGGASGGVRADDAARAAAEDAYALLAPDAARLYRLLSLREWPAIGPGTACWATGLARARTAPLLEDLAARHLLEHTPEGRYAYRPAVRRHAEEAALREDGLAACSAAVTRTVEGHLRLALRAAHAALPESWRVPPLPEEPAQQAPDGPPRDQPRNQPGDQPDGYADRAAAVEALSAEAGNLLEALRTAEEFGDAETVVLLGQTLWPLQLKAGHHDMLLPGLQRAVRTADRHRPGTRAAGALHAQVAHSLTELRRFDEAEAEARAAAEHERAAGHTRGHASSAEFLGLLRLAQWRFAEAYDCFEESARLYGAIGPHDEGVRDLPRAQALLERHRGRALRGLGQRAEAAERLHSALRFFRGSGEAYNTARTLTDLAGTALDGEDTATALPLIDEAMTLLQGEGAAYHLAYLSSLRERCVTPRHA